MIGAALNAFVPWRVSKLHFDGQNGEAARANTRGIVDTFLLGAKRSFAGDGADRFREAEASVPWTRRPFFWEGHAFGGAANAACRLSRTCSDARYFAPGYRFMFFTGVGFWNGVAAHYHLPGIAVERSDVPDFDFGIPFIAGGLSFGAIALAGRFESQLLDRLERDAGDRREWRRGLAMGAGRALWFLHMNDFPRLAEIVAGDDDMALGLGVAMGFTQLAEPRAILEGLDRLPTRAKIAATRGVRACLAGAAKDDPRVLPELEALPAPLPEWLRIGTAALEHAGHGKPGFFDRFLNALGDVS